MSVPDEGYSRNMSVPDEGYSNPFIMSVHLYLMKVIPETCRMH